MPRQLSMAMVLAAVFALAARPGGAARTQAPASTMALLFTVGPRWDSTKAPSSQLHFATHSANLRRLRDAGVIVAGGRFGGYGLILVRAPSRDSAAALLKPDSSLVAGTFRVEIQPWSTVYEGTIAR